MENVIILQYKIIVEYTMWFILRPDATNVWKNKTVCKRYSRYKGILDGNRIPRYLITKKIGIETSLDEPLNVLWKAHEQAAKEFKKLIKNIDSGKITID